MQTQSTELGGWVPISIKEDGHPDFNAHPLLSPSQKGWKVFAITVSCIRAQCVVQNSIEITADFDQLLGIGCSS